MKMLYDGYIQIMPAILRGRSENASEKVMPELKGIEIVWKKVT